MNSQVVPMSTVEMELHAQTFVVAETARVVLTATCAITENITDPKLMIMDAAAQINPGEWYIIDAKSHQDTSGIETLTYTLSVRMPESQATSIGKTLGEVNRAGLRFILKNVDYTPTRDQKETASRDLRKQIYAKAMEELSILNETCGGEDSWVIGSIDFTTEPELAKANRGNMLYQSVGTSGDEIPSDTGITQKMSLRARVSFTRKIYSRL